MSKKILFFGNERLATGVTTTTPTLKALIDAGHDIAAVVVAQNETGKSRKARDLEIAILANKHHIEVLAPDDLTKASQELRALEADIAILIAYGKLIPKSLIELFPQGIINVHPSLLPLYRGSTPLESAILQGDSQTGVSLMKLTPLMDAGPIYGQEDVGLTGNETKQELADNLSLLGANLVTTHLPRILDGSLMPTHQNDALATYCQQINKTDRELDFAKPAQQLEREVRAYAGWPRSHTTIGNTDVIITQTHVVKGQGAPGTIWRENNHLGVHTASNILAVDRLIPSGKAEMSSAAFLSGYQLT